MPTVLKKEEPGLLRRLAGQAIQDDGRCQGLVIDRDTLRTGGQDFRPPTHKQPLPGTECPQPR